MRLVLVELTRLRWRRAVVLLVGAAILFSVVLLAIRAYETRPLGDGDIAEAQAAVDQELAYQAESLDGCLENPEEFIGPGADVAQCESYFSGYTPRLEDFLYREPLVVADERGSSGLAVAAVVGLLMLLVGTTYIGHDWNTGSMSNQLLFESRRLRVWASKAVAVALLAASVSVAALAIFWGGLLLVAQTRDVATPDQALVDVLQHSLRTTTMVVAGAVGGYALTALTRSTVFTIAALAVVGIAGGIVFGILGNGALRWEPATNGIAVINGRAEYYVEIPEKCYAAAEFDPTGECDATREVTVQQGLGYYGVGVLLIGAASAASYRRRDVP